jgi:hypothetical protein
MRRMRAEVLGGWLPSEGRKIKKVLEKKLGLSFGNINQTFLFCFLFVSTLSTPQAIYQKNLVGGKQIINQIKLLA